MGLQRYLIAGETVGGMPTLFVGMNAIEVKVTRRHVQAFDSPKRRKCRPELPLPDGRGSVGAVKRDSTELASPAKIGSFPANSLRGRACKLQAPCHNRSMLLPRFSVRWLLGLTTVAAVVFFVISLAVRFDSQLLAGIAAACVSFFVLLAVHALLFAIIWTFAGVTRWGQPGPPSDSRGNS